MTEMMDENWVLSEPESFALPALKGWEGLFTQGSGYLHVRGSLEEHLSDAAQAVTYLRRPTNVTSEQFPTTKAKWGTFVPGIYGQHPLMGKELANLPWFMQIVPIVDGEQLDMEHSTISSYRRALNLRTAVLTRRLHWQTTSGAQLELTFERYANAVRPHLFLQRLTLTSDRAVDLTIHSGIDSGVRTSGYDHFRQVTFTRLGTPQIGCAVVLDTGDQVNERMWAHLDGAEWSFHDEGRAAHLRATVLLRAGQTVTFEKRTAVTTSFDVAPLDIQTLLALDVDYAGLLREHRVLWDQRWENADVQR